MYSDQSRSNLAQQTFLPSRPSQDRKEIASPFHLVYSSRRTKIAIPRSWAVSGYQLHPAITRQTAAQRKNVSRLLLQAISPASFSRFSLPSSNFCPQVKAQPPHVVHGSHSNHHANHPKPPTHRQLARQDASLTTTLLP